MRALVELFHAEEVVEGVGEVVAEGGLFPAGGAADAENGLPGLELGKVEDEVVVELGDW